MQPRRNYHSYKPRVSSSWLIASDGLFHGDSIQSLRRSASSGRGRRSHGRRRSGRSDSRARWGLCLSAAPSFFAYGANSANEVAQLGPRYIFHILDKKFHIICNLRISVGPLIVRFSSSNYIHATSNHSTIKQKIEPGDTASISTLSIKF